MLNFNYKSLSVLSKFFQYRNEIDIYTEDKTADKEFYRVLFSRLTEDKVKINDVTPLGCKTNVLNEYDKYKNDTSRKRIFIVDGDLELINGTNPKTENNLFVLEAYCIENILIDKNAAIELIYVNKATVEKQLIEKELKFEEWLHEMHEELIEMFFHFAVLRKFGGGPKIKKAKDFLIQEKKESKLNLVGVQDYTTELKAEIIDLLIEKEYDEPHRVFETEIEKLKHKWSCDISTLLRVVSAKNYLLPLLNYKIKSCIKGGNSLFPVKSFKMFLASNCDLERLGDLRRILIN